jgi:hypothetical protein
VKIYQPMLFVGLGGTGCAIGAALERRLREELCGPDGTNLRDLLPGKEYLPFQLPACTQFVYADLNESELVRLERATVPSGEHQAAGRRTRHLITELVPSFDTYPEVARALRNKLPQLVEGWLPPPKHEPRVAPLSKGAGQLPTVARAALFETFRTGIAAARDPLKQAIDELATSNGDLNALNSNTRERLDAADVYVAFSMAGGTGAGIFYDFLHLIGDVFQQEFPPDFTVRIYPLVIMPSAFPEGQGGGRRAVLNAGRGLLDLFRLVDDQNGQAALTDLDGEDNLGSLTVRYARDREIRLRASTIQTAFLFSSAPGVQREDLHRSVVALIQSLIGTEMPEEEQAGQGRDRLFHSFSDSFINRGVERETTAPTGVGRRGVSTGLVASLTVPADDIADIVGSRLLAAAVAELAATPLGGAESNRALIERFCAAANLQPLLTREPLPFNDPATDFPKGAEAIRAALAERLRLMQANLEAMSRQLPARAGELARRFDPGRAVEELLGEVDLFRLHRVVHGDPALPEEIDRQGVAGLLRRRREVPPTPQGITSSGPVIQPLPRKLGRWRWTDPEVQQQVWLQDTWYHWRTRCLWNDAWARQSPAWEPKIHHVARQLDECVGGFRDHSEQDPARFRRRVEELYRPRAGVRYLLPPQGRDLRLFYQSVVNRFAERYAAEGMPPNATEGEIMAFVLRRRWWKAFDNGCKRGAEAALESALDDIKPDVRKVFAWRSADRHPLLPRLADLLAGTAGKGSVKVAAEDLEQFRQDLAALLPGGFSPQGTGTLRTLITYPADSPDPDLQRYIEANLNLPRTRGAQPEFRPVNAEALTVVLFRTSMSVTEVPELRSVLHQWTLALKREEPEDFLRWRQRLGYDYGYLLTTPEHREGILHRFLCALWNGQMSVPPGDDPASPERVTFRLPAPDAAVMTLHLTPYERASSWGSIIRAYEEWVLKDDQRTRLDVCEGLMDCLPAGIDKKPQRPHELYDVVVGMIKKQEDLLEDMMTRLPEAGRGWAGLLLEFWQTTLPGALRREFDRVQNPVRANLLELEKEVRDRGL